MCTDSASAPVNRPACRADAMSRFLCDQSGSELIQFVLVLPILVAFVWACFEIWQLMTLRSAARAAVAQAARYVTGYTGLPDTIPNRPTTLEIRQSAEQIIGAALAREHGLFGGAATWDVAWYKVNDPGNFRWDGNVSELDAFDPLATLLCKDQFGIRLHMRVPWTTVVFGFAGTPPSPANLEMTDTAVGALPCLPVCELHPWVNAFSQGPGGCRVEVCWEFDCTFEPGRVEIWQGPNLLWFTDAPLDDTCAVVNLANGSGSVTVIAFGGQRQMSWPVLPGGCP